MPRRRELWTEKDPKNVPRKEELTGKKTKRSVRCWLVLLYQTREALEERRTRGMRKLGRQRFIYSVVATVLLTGDIKVKPDIRSNLMDGNLEGFSSVNLLEHAGRTRHTKSTTCVEI